MKYRQIVVLLIACALAGSAWAQDDRGLQSTAETVTTQSPNDSAGVSAAPLSKPPVSLALPDLLIAYQTQIQMVFEKTCADLEQIAQAVRSGAMSRERAEYSAVSRYQVGMMTLELLHTLYQATEESIQRAAQAQKEKAELEVFGAPVVIPTPTSSEVDDQVARYLELDPAQITAIQEQLTEHRKQVQPLIGQIADNQRTLNSVTQKEQFDERQVRALAVQQSRMLERLILANATLEVKLYSMLTSEQKRRVEDIRRQEAAAPARP
jgi:Spy/CpxP family protein refolding chaperone